MKNVISVIIRAQMRWVGHIIRMDDHCMPHQLLYVGDWEETSRPQCYKDAVKDALRHCDIQPRELEAAAADRTFWQALCYDASTGFEDRCHQKLIENREQHHRITPTASTTMDFQCPHCARLCASRLGLQSCLHVHRRNAQQGVFFEPKGLPYNISASANKFKVFCSSQPLNLQCLLKKKRHNHAENRGWCSTPPFLFCLGKIVDIHYYLLY